MSETNEYYFQKYVEGRIEEASALGEARGREIGEARGEARGREIGKAQGKEDERNAIKERLNKIGLDKELQQYLCEMLFAK